MSDPMNLTEVRTAIARHLIADGVDFYHNTTMLAREIADIAAPIIERQVREQIAAEIEARIKPPSDRPIRDTEGALTAAVTVALQQGMRSAARIAREVCSDG